MFFNYIEENYYDLKKIYCKFCKLNNLKFDEDTFEDTIEAVANVILKKNLKDTTIEGIENYFFKSFKFNTFQASKKKIRLAEKFDTECEIKDEIDEASSYDEMLEEEDKKLMAKCKCYELIKENFDEADYIIFRLKHNFLENGKELTFKEIKNLLNIKNVRQRLLNMHRFLKENKNKIFN